MSVDSEKGTFTLHKTSNLVLYQKTVFFELFVKSPGQPDFSTMISVNYESNGPVFELEFGSLQTQPLTCSPKDEGWSFSLPPLLAESQQNVELSFLEEDEFSKMFEFDLESRILTLKSKYETELIQGNLCPGVTKQVTFELKSDLLGANKQIFDVRTQPDSAGTELFDFDNVSLETFVETQLTLAELASNLSIDELKALLLKSKQSANDSDASANGLRPPEIRSKIQSDGKVILKFTNEMVFPENL